MWVNFPFAHFCGTMPCGMYCVVCIDCMWPIVSLYHVLLTFRLMRYRKPIPFTRSYLYIYEFCGGKSWATYTVITHTTYIRGIHACLCTRVCWQAFSSITPIHISKAADLVDLQAMLCMCACVYEELHGKLKERVIQWLCYVYVCISSQSNIFYTP